MMDPYGFYESTLPKLRAARLPRPSGGADDALLAIARLGFTDFGDGAAWTVEHVEYVRETIAQEYNPTAMAEFDDARDALCYAALYAVGALLGQWASGALDDTQFLAFRVVLPGFLLNEMEAIEAAATALPPLPAPPERAPRRGPRR